MKIWKHMKASKAAAWLSHIGKPPPCSLRFTCGKRLSTHQSSATGIKFDSLCFFISNKLASPCVYLTSTHDIPPLSQRKWWKDFRRQTSIKVRSRGVTWDPSFSEPVSKSRLWHRTGCSEKTRGFGHILYTGTFVYLHHSISDYIHDLSYSGFQPCRICQPLSTSYCWEHSNELAAQKATRWELTLAFSGM